MLERAGVGSATYLKLGLRNLWRNPLRTSLVLGSLVIGFASMTFVGALQEGLARDARENFILTQNGHVQIHVRGFEDSRQIQDPMREPEVVTRFLDGAPDIAAWTTRVRTSGMASVAEASVGVQVMGVDIEREPHVTRLAQFVADGDWLASGHARDLLLGRDLAEILGAGIGDKVILMAQSSSGDIATELFRLRGVLHSGLPLVDRALALVPLAAAQEMLELKHGVTDVVVRASRHDATDSIRDRLRTALPETEYEILRWADLDPLLQQRIEMGDALSYLVLLFVVLVVLLEVVNTMLMALHERTREFGLMEALGTKKRQIFATVLWESLLLVMIGCVGGYLLGGAAALHFGRIGIDVAGYGESFTYVYLSPVLHPLLTWHSAVRIIGTTFVAALIGSVYPAWKATRHRPVEAMRHV